MRSLEAERERHRNRRRAQKAGKPVREYKRTGLQCEDVAEWRREYKRLQRRKAGAVPRADIAARSQAKREALAPQQALRRAISALHDAHVRR